MISDFMKALDGVDVVIVYARQEDGIRFAVRSDEKRVNVGVLLKRCFTVLVMEAVTLRWQEAVFPKRLPNGLEIHCMKR